MKLNFLVSNHYRNTEAYSESRQTSKMKLFAKLFNCWKPLTIFAKYFILDVWLGFELDRFLRFIRNPPYSRNSKFPQKNIEQKITVRLMPLSLCVRSTLLLNMLNKTTFYIRGSSIRCVSKIFRKTDISNHLFIY